MFDSLDEQIKRDENRVSSGADRIMRWAIMLLAAALVLGGLIIGVHFMS